MMSLLAEADANLRFDYHDERTISVRAFGGVAVAELAEDLLALNGECSRLIGVFKAAKAG